MVTVVSLGLPSLTPASGIAPKLSLTLSPSSLSASSSAAKVKVWAVSPLLKVTLPGTPE